MNTMRKQSGFTLIELMIVIAILAILLAIAIPAYQDYSVRARVSEGINMAASAKLAVSEHRLSEGAFPSSNPAAGYQTGVSTLVHEIAISGNGVITITYSNDSRLADAANTTLTYTPTFSGTAVMWNCQTGSIPNKYVPAECR